MYSKNDEIYFRALLLIARFNEKFLELASLLRQLQENDPVWFKVLISNRRLGKRKGYYLIEIDPAFGGLGLPSFRLNLIGWTKLQVVAKYVTPDNVESLLKLAEGHTAENLKALMRGEEAIIDGRTVVLRFTKGQFAEFAVAVVGHGAIPSEGGGFYFKERALIKALRKNKE